MVQSSKKGFKALLLVAIALVAMASVAFAFNLPGMGKYEKVKPAAGSVTIPVAKVSDGKAHFYKFADAGKEINFFIVKGSDGQLHVAFDACDVCYREKKGYEQQGDKMNCLNCNQKFAINRIGAASGGGCNPSYLAAKVDGGKVTISVNDLKAGARFF
ncbi:DUF2318 domain-containing protein [Geomonas sp. Red69]|uniref:DUF2318 domain-containing protein n=1 Tax=Geomonas diazotrophica TaxID=2843197 RepID=A0ABX8JHD3_9BACT|nr:MULTISPECIES: DUF2318 domain-containing protein [Geomonas]MBU5637890.1 DUF2318 domain-containing protein [Geomonas diazotrophica]QWV96536.1 DUF2318 domain-containing protein [Geomonas nitrogeniifigens]QXE85641.1 DUF2318 domain-containing protein [Geomonas nitrogeniifigens]